MAKKKKSRKKVMGDSKKKKKSRKKVVGGSKKKKKSRKKVVGDSKKEDSPWARVSQEAYQSGELRKGLMQKIEKQLNATAILYFTSFYDEDALINDIDAEMIENM